MMHAPVARHATANDMYANPHTPRRTRATEPLTPPEQLCRATQNDENDVLITMFPGADSTEISSAIEGLTLAQTGVFLRMHFYTDSVVKQTNSSTPGQPPEAPSKHTAHMDFLEFFTAMQGTALALSTSTLYLRWANTTTSPMLFVSKLKLFPNLASATLAPPGALSQNVLHTQNLRHLNNVVKELPLLTELTLTLQDSKCRTNADDVFAAVLCSPLAKITVVLQRRTPRAETVTRCVAMAPPEATLKPRWTTRDFEMHITQSPARCEANERRTKRLLAF